MLAVICALIPIQNGFAEQSFSGWLDLQQRYYPDTSEQVSEKSYPSAAVQLEYSRDLSDSDQLVATVFARGDAVDDERNLFDVREFLWLHQADAYQFQLGVGQVTWGVNELFKITDQINQKDRAELPVPRKLGQPMASVSFYWGDDLVELYALYDVRPAWFPGQDGRLRPPILVDNDNQLYDRGKTGRWDFAARWQTRFKDIDINVSHFYGVTRDPYFAFNFDFENPYLVPVYEKVNQTSVDMIYAWNDVLLKAELTYQMGGIEQFESVAGGFEYTMGGLFDSDVDLTWFVETIWDSRDQIDGTLFDHDIGIAARIAFNDARDSNLILGLVVDYEYDEAFGSLFWSNSFGESWKLNVIGQYFYANEPRLDVRNYVAPGTAFYELLNATPADYPLPQEIIEDVLAVFDGTTISKKQYDLLTAQLQVIQNDPTFFEGVDNNDAAQTLFDLLRTSDNTQKMNLLERDAFIQVDLYYYF